MRTHAGRRFRSAGNTPAAPLARAPPPSRYRRGGARHPGARRGAVCRSAELRAVGITRSRRIRGHRERRRRRSRCGRAPAGVRVDGQRAGSRRGTGSARLRGGDGARRWRVRQLHRCRGDPESRRAEQSEEHVVLGGSRHLGDGRGRPGAWRVRFRRTPDDATRTRSRGNARRARRARWAVDWRLGHGHLRSAARSARHATRRAHARAVRACDADG